MLPSHFVLNAAITHQKPAGAAGSHAKAVSKTAGGKPKRNGITSVDEQFIRQSIDTVEQNISDPDFFLLKT